MTIEDSFLDIPLTPEIVKEARHRLWRMGDLTWKLDPTQQALCDFYKNKNNKTTVINCSRRLGKSYFLTILAIEQCLKKPKSIVKMLQPEQKMVRTNIKPIMEKILTDCPDDLMPQFKTMDNVYVFPNGSLIQLGGTDNGNYDKLRGGDSHLCIIDEAGFCSDLNHIINRILIPTTTLTGGRVILSSTTPPNPAHEFIKYMEYATKNGNLIKKTIYDAINDSKHEKRPRITDMMIASIIESLPGGAKSDEFRNEYLCEIIIDSDKSVIPEFAAVQNDVVTNWPRPVFFDRYVGMDIGFEDFTGVIFAYWDFDNGVVVCEDELLINGPKMTTETLAAEIKRKEQTLWTDSVTGEFYDPYKRVSDNNPILLNDLSRLHNLYFMATAKDNKDAQVNNTRMMIASHQVIIHPRCVNLVEHIKNATWNKQRSDFVRSGDYGHYDLLAALIYLLRNIDKSRNPYPKGYKYSKLGRYDDVHINPYYKPAGGPTGFDKLVDQFKVKSTYYKKK